MFQEKPSTIILLRLISTTDIDPQANLEDKQGVNTREVYKQTTNSLPFK